MNLNIHEGILNFQEKPLATGSQTERSPSIFNLKFIFICLNLMDPDP
jgi:hypothetical protein